MDACRDVDSLFRYYKDLSNLESYFTVPRIYTGTIGLREKLEIKLIDYRLDEIVDCLFWLIYQPDVRTERVLRKFMENVVDTHGVIICVRGDTYDIRNTTKILLEMGRDTEFTVSQLSGFVGAVVKYKTGYETGRGFVEQLFAIDMILEPF